jgi:hypothetical protein
VTVFLDDSAREVVMTMLGGVPGLLDDLETTLTRRHRFAPGAPVRGVRAEDRLPFHMAASIAADHIEVVLRVFCARLRVGRGREDAAEQARWLRACLPSIPGDHPGLEGFEHALVNAVANGFAAVDRPPDRVYLGLCECGQPVYAAPEAPRAQCACGVELLVADRRAQMLEQARYRFGTADELTRLLPWFGGTPISKAALVKAGERGRVPSIKAGGRVLYRLGDVVDWHAARHAHEGERL